MSLLKQFKKYRSLSNRISKSYPSDTISQHFKRVGEVRKIQTLADIENSMSNRPVQPSPKKPEIKIKRERLLP